MCPLLLAFTLGFGPSQAETFAPEPLPAWADALDLSTDPKYVNLRAVGPAFKALRPAFRVGDITNAIKEDATLIIGQDKPIGRRPLGARTVQMDDYIRFHHVANGFSRDVVTVPSNEAVLYTLDVANPKSNALQFRNWFGKLTKQFGKPNVVIRRENSEDINGALSDERPYPHISDPTIEGQSVLTLIWIWGISESNPNKQFEPVYNEKTMDLIAGPTSCILLTYAEKSVATEKGKKRFIPRAIRLWINPSGIMAG